MAEQTPVNLVRIHFHNQLEIASIHWPKGVPGIEAARESFEEVVKELQFRNKIHEVHDRLMAEAREITDDLRTQLAEVNEKLNAAQPFNEDAELESLRNFLGDMTIKMPVGRVIGVVEGLQRRVRELRGEATEDKAKLAGSQQFESNVRQMLNNNDGDHSAQTQLSLIAMCLGVYDKWREERSGKEAICPQCRETQFYETCTKCGVQNVAF